MTAQANPREPAAERAPGDFRSPMRSLPYWARASNPIVRRHLGLYWRTLPPELKPVFTITGAWLLALLVGIVFPLVIDLATMLIVVSVIVIPVGMLFYLSALVSICANAAAVMADEIRNNTLTLLMSTPMTLEQILLGKVASAIWRKMDDLVLILYGAAIFGPPLIVMHYAGIFPIRESGALTIPLIAVMMVTSLLRLLLEPLMLGMVGVAIGAYVPYRSIAMGSAVAWMGFYFLLINMLQQLNLRSIQAALEGAAAGTLGQGQLVFAAGLTITLELVLPLALPLALLQLVSRLLQQRLLTE